MLAFLRRKYLVATVVFLVLLIGGAIFFYWRYGGSNLNKEEKKAKTESKTLYDRVGKHFVLPTDELPTVATVTDPEKLRGQTFFTKAKKGDKVLIFTNAKEAILYDPSIDKVVAVAPLNIDENKSLDKEGNGTSVLNNEF